MTELCKPPEIFLELPLYSKCEWEIEEVFSIAQILFYQGTIDSYCVGCGRESTFHSTNNTIPSELTLEAFNSQKRKYSAIGISPGSRPPSPPKPPLVPVDIYAVTFVCGRNQSHNLRFFYLIKNDVCTDGAGKNIIKQSLQKIGQYPSLADLNLPSIHKYRAVLANDVYMDLSRGIGLAAHDVGIGAYVYLRRVFERLIEQAHFLAMSTAGWDEKAYQKLRVTERVVALIDHLPKFLVDHPEMYSLLSKGIHELSEVECLRHFPAIKVGIELILDEQIENKSRKLKLVEASKAIKEATQAVKQLDTGKA